MPFSQNEKGACSQPEITDDLGAHPTGLAVLKNAFLNKGTAFTEDERDFYKIRGLIPPAVCSIEIQEARVLENLRRKTDPLEKYIFLRALCDRNEHLFYRVVINNVTEMMPLIYTPTVGAACQQFGHIFRQPRGMYISLHEQGHVRRILDNWILPEVKVIVVTDGERILGLGDLGAFGMGIPVGKLALYTACAGVHPKYCLPVQLDVGTNNKKFLEDPLYTGLVQSRIKSEGLDVFVDEFINAVVDKWGPSCLIQFEDFGNTNAFRLLNYYKNKVCCFNDDIQGTASVSLAGILSALRLTKKSILEQTFLFLGAGEAGTGIGDLIVAAMVEAGMSLEEARKRQWFVDSKGLVVKSRTPELQEHKLHYAHDFEAGAVDFLTAIKLLKPTGIIGVSAQPQAFNRDIIEAISEINDRPLIFALSNPTSLCECTAEQAYTWSKGRCVLATGSPFAPVVVDGKTYVTGQANNSYVFPGIGLGVVVSGSRHVSDKMFLGAAQTLAQMAQPADLESGCIFPPLSRIRDVSVEIATVVAEMAYAEGTATVPRPADLRAYVQSQMYDPHYDVLKVSC